MVYRILGKMKIQSSYTSKNLTLEFNSDQSLTSFIKKKELEKILNVFVKEAQLELIGFKQVKQFEFSIKLISDAKMKKINLKYRNKNKTTDVLSFPLEEFLYQNKKIKIPYIYLGDLFVSPKVCQRQAKEREMSFGRELAHLLTHGFFHLLDYDHERSLRDEKLMFKMEEKLLKRIVVQFSNL
jgi:rRNA maturation RNase YbeY